MKNVAVVIVNYNTFFDTIECLKSLSNLEYKQFDVYIVDNCSTNQSVEELSKFLGSNTLGLSIELMISPSNTGFAGGNNFAIRKILDSSYYDYIWLLNNDTEVDSHALTAMVEEMENYDKVGITGSKIYYHSSNRLWFAGGVYNEKTGKTKHIGIDIEDQGQFNMRKNVNYITGCSLLIRTNLVKKIGLLPEEYFMYYEEIEWNLKVELEGYIISYCPNSIVYHKIGSSSGGLNNPSPSVLYYKLRNRILFIKRNSVLSPLFVFSILVEVVKKLIKVILNNDHKLRRIGLIMKSLFHGFKGISGKLFD